MKDSEPRPKGSGDNHTHGSGGSHRLEIAVEAALVILRATEETWAGGIALPRPKQQRGSPAENMHHLQGMWCVLSPSPWEQKVLMENWTSSNL